MSHKAVNWALEQKQLKPGVWIVLIQLADRHNKDTRLVFPEQSLLATDCNISRATLNRHLSELEDEGLIFRVQRINASTKKSMATHYILQSDFPNPPNIDHAVEDYRAALLLGKTGNTEAGRVSNCDMGAVSQKTAIPCLNFDDSRVSNCDTNLVREPIKEPCAVARAGGSDFDDFWKVYPKPRAEAACRDLFDRALDDGVDGTLIVEAARAYAAEFAGEKQRYAVGSHDWLSGQRWEKYARPAAGSVVAVPTDVVVFYADWIKSGRSFPSSALKAGVAREMLQRNLITLEQLRAVGVVA